jgi:hypothetical protein
MHKSIFFTGQPIFNQVLSFIPRSIIRQVSREFKADHYCKKFSTYDHLVTLLYCVFNHCSSLREVCSGLLAWEQRIGHIGMLHHPRRSTVSDANSRRDASVFEAIYFKLLQKYDGFLSDSRHKKLYIFDSTTITLFSQVLQGTGLANMNGRRKGGIKVHTLIRSDQDVPCMIRFSAAKNNDVQFLKEVQIAKGSVIVFDRGYADYKSYNRFNTQGITWVTRLRTPTVYKTVELRAVAELQQQQGILEDREIIIGHDHQKTAVKVKARLIVFKASDGKVFEFLTNNFRCAPITIANYYRKRWQIELLFKRIKQNYPLKYFLGDSENAIKIQIWTVLIADLILKVIKKGTHCKMSFSNLASMIRLHLMTYTNLSNFLRSPDKELRRKIKFWNLKSHSPTLF